MKKSLFFTAMFFLLTVHSDVLTPKDIINSVEKNFINLLIQEEKIIQANEQINRARGDYDSEFKGKVNAVPVGGYEHFYYEGTLIYPIENTGNTLSAGYRLGKGDWPLYYQNNLTNTQGDTFIGINIPLLRNKHIDATRQNIMTNTLLEKSEKMTLLMKKNQVIFQAMSVYYEWVGASERVTIAKKLLEIAEIRQVAIDKQALLGDIAKINQVENKRLIMQRKSGLTSENQKFINAQNKLNFYINSKEWKQNNRELEAPSLSRLLLVFKNHPITFSDIIHFQPYINFLDIQIQKNKVAIQKSKNDMKSGLDLSFDLNKQHGAGSTQLSETSLRIGLKYTLPLRLRKSEGAMAINQSKIREYALKKAFFIRELKLTYENTMNDLISLQKIYAFRKQEVDYTEELVNAERQRFTAGDSSLFLVNQREKDAALTKRLVIDVIIAYNQKINFIHSISFPNSLSSLAL